MAGRESTAMNADRQAQEAAVAANPAAHEIELFSRKDGQGDANLDVDVDAKQDENAMEGGSSGSGSSSSNVLPRFYEAHPFKSGPTSRDLEEQQHHRYGPEDSHPPAAAFVPQRGKPPFPPTELDHTNHQRLPRWLSRPLVKVADLPYIRRATAFLRGPPPDRRRPPRLWNIAILERIELSLVRYTRWTSRPELLWIFLLAWFLGLTFLTRAAWYHASAGSDVTWLDGTSTFWLANDGCGLGGANCAPFVGFTSSYRCPSKVADTKLLNIRAVGPLEVINTPLIVGGGDEQGTYRADSFICAAAVHRGLFSNGDGGCLTLTAIGNYSSFVGSTVNGYTSVSFDSEFPFAYRFNETSQTDCRDLRNDILAYDTVMSAAFGLLIRATSGVFYWVSVCFGFWHITLASDPRSFPPDLADAFGSFLPCLFICYVFYRFAFRWVLPAFSGRIIERTVLFYGPYWVFLLSNYTLDQIPIDRLTASDIKQQRGGIIAIVILAVVLVIVAINQIRVIRTTGWLPYYLGWYILGGLIILVLSQLPGLVLRIHHYIAAMALIPATAFPTRLGLLYQGILLGLFINGAARWGFDSILQTEAQVRRDAPLGSDLPAFNLTDTIDTLTKQITWSSIPTSLQSSWDGFSLIVNDVLVYTTTSSASQTNYTLSPENGYSDTSIPYYLRLAYTSGGVAGDFTRAATAWLSNGTWVPPEPGPS